MPEIEFHIGTRRDGRPFALPQRQVTGTVAMLGVKESGKTWSAGVFEEEMAEHGVPFVVLDPMGAHIGIKQKYEVIIFGGRMQDVPLSPDLGRELAQAINAEQISAILDISGLTLREQRRLVADFCNELYSGATSPRQVIIEECQEFIPQAGSPATQASSEAIDRLVRLGRQKGLGSTLLGQRSAKIDKDVISQVGTLFMFRTSWNTDVNVFVELLKDSGQEERLAEFRSSIRTLKSGECWVWSPALNLPLERLVIKERRTIHMGATPDLGEALSFEAVKVDASALAARFGELVQQKAAEQTELAQARRELRRLETQVEELRRGADIAGVLRQAVSAVSQGEGGQAALDALGAEMEKLRAEMHGLRVEDGQKDEELVRLRQTVQEMAEAARDRDKTTEAVRLISQGFGMLGLGAPHAVQRVVEEPDLDELAQRVAARLPSRDGAPMLVAPTAALRKRFLEEEVTRLLEDVRNLTARQRDYLLWLAQHGARISIREAIRRVTGREITSGGAYKTQQNDLVALKDLGLVDQDSHGIRASVEERVRADLKTYGVTDEEIGQVVARMLTLLAQEGAAA